MDFGIKGKRALVLGGMPPAVRTAFETTWRDAYDALRRPVSS